MKKIISFSLALTFATGIYALPFETAPGKVLSSFHRDFPNIQNQTVSNFQSSAIVFFKVDDHLSCRAFYDLKGNLLDVIKYYDASKLSPFIREKIQEKFPGKKIGVVTEMISENNHFYQIQVLGNKVWYEVKYDPNGSISVQKKWHNA